MAVERRGRSRVSFWRRRRTIERKKARSGPEDKCLPTRRPARFYQGSRSSRFTKRKRSEMEKKSERMAEGEEQREREREKERKRERIGWRWRHNGHNWSPRCKCTCNVRMHRLELVSFSVCRLAWSRFQLPIGIRGNRDRDWDLKCYMNVCTYVGAIGRRRRVGQPLAGPCERYSGAYVRMQLARDPPTLRERASTLTCFYPAGSFVI